MKRIKPFIFIILFFIHSYLYSKICQIHIPPNKNIIPLKQEWNFFKGGGNVAANPDLDVSSWKTISVPFKWSQISDLKRYKGEIWLRCNILMDTIPEEIYFDLGFIREIDEVFWNGKRIGGTGNFEERMPDFSERRIYSIPPEQIQNHNVLAIHLYGSFWNAGIPNIPRLVLSSDLLHKKFKFEMLAFAFSLTYIFSAIFFIFYGFYTQERKSNFYFAAFTILLALYHMLLWGMRNKFFGNFILSYIFELLLLIPLPLLFFSFLKEWLNINPGKIYIISKFFTIFLMIAAITGYFIPYIYRTEYLHIVTYVNLINILIIVYKTISILFYYRKEKEEQTKFLNYGLLALVPFIINDSLVALDIIHTPRTFVFAYPIFLLVFAINLSEKALKLKKQSDIKADELRKLEKQKLNVIYNISNEFQSIFEELKQSMILKKNNEATIKKLEYLLESAEILHLLEQRQYVLQPYKANIIQESAKIIEDVLKATQQTKDRIQLNFPKDYMVSFWIDIRLYRIILYHLIENALIYSSEEVELHIQIESEQLKIKVYDKGPGIPLEIQDKIFLKYIRGNHREIPGSGIGLTLVKESVELLSGEIQFDSKLNFYTWFEVQLPPLREIA